MPVTEIPVFFIVGRGRSGSTLLRSILDAHPQVKIPMESRFVQFLYYLHYNRKIWMPENTLPLIQQLEKGFEPPNLDQEKFIAAVQENAGGLSFSTVCRLIYRNIISASPKTEIAWLGDKNPRYSFFIPVLFKHFPEARFVHLVRDYRDNILSVKRSHKTIGETGNPYVACGRWKLYNRIVEKSKRQNPERFLTLRYEDLVTDPEKEIRRICVFLNLNFEPGMLSYAKNVEEYYADKTFSTLHPNLKKPPDTSRIGQWENEISKRTLKRCAVLAGKLPELYGYKSAFTVSAGESFVIKLAFSPLVFLGQLRYLVKIIFYRIPWIMKPIYKLMLRLI